MTEISLSMEELQTMRWALTELCGNRHSNARWIRRFHAEVEALLSRVELTIKQAEFQRSTNHQIFQDLMADQHAETERRREIDRINHPRARSLGPRIQISDQREGE